MQIDAGIFFNSRGLQLQEYNLLAEVGPDYWHSTILNVDGFPVAGGFGMTLSVARKIALAEFLERDRFKSISLMSENVRAKWGLNLISTGCGFAAGFNLKNTILRSIGESLERWVMSKWIDENFFLQEIDKSEIVSGLDPVSSWLFSQFDDVHCYEKEVLVEFLNSFYRFKIAITVAVKNDGVFVGTSANYSDEVIWQHALLESFRHYLVCKNTRSSGKFPDNRIRYFSKNASVAFAQISAASKLGWPTPRIIHHMSESFDSEQYFLARTIVDGWKSWHLGPITRFLY